MFGQIAGEAVSYGSGAAGEQQLQRHWPADDIGGANDYGVQTVQVDPVLSSSVMIPFGVQGRSSGIRWARRPTL